MELLGVEAGLADLLLHRAHVDLNLAGVSGHGVKDPRTQPGHLRIEPSNGLLAYRHEHADFLFRRVQALGEFGDVRGDHRGRVPLDQRKAGVGGAEAYGGKLSHAPSVLEAHDGGDQISHPGKGLGVAENRMELLRDVPQLAENGMDEGASDVFGHRLGQPLERGKRMGEPVQPAPRLVRTRARVDVDGGVQPQGSDGKGLPRPFAFRGTQGVVVLVLDLIARRLLGDAPIHGTLAGRAEHGPDLIHDSRDV